MMATRIRSARAILERRDRLYGRWEELRLRYAPHREGIWSFSSSSTLVGQGWKLHLSATLLTAVDLLERCGDALVASGTPFKVIAELSELDRLNSGTLHGRSQIGKVITAYCPEPDVARLLAEELHGLAGEIACPEVPSDRRFREASCVFYRYGAYEKLEVEHNGERVPAYRDLAGRLVPDRRTAATAVPDWVVDPFEVASLGDCSKSSSTARYKATAAIQWRGGGGVYNVLDTFAQPPKNYIMKTGIRHGGVGIDGVDGAAQRAREHQTLRTLGNVGIPVPQVIDFFRQGGNVHLVLTLIPGRNLWQTLSAGEIDPTEARRLAVQLVDIVASIHAAGWVWRDCKLGNLIDDGHQLWALDFESAFRIGGRPRLLCYTPGYLMEQTEMQTGRAAVRQDLCALGITLHRVLCCEPEIRGDPVLPVKPLPKSVPTRIKEGIRLLCDPNPAKRPTAAEVKALFAHEMWRSASDGAGPPLSLRP